jgi:hypothetical protein
MSTELFNLQENFMKNYMLIFSLALAVSLAGCSKDNDDNNTPAETPTGTVEMIFIPMVGNDALQMNESFTTPAGEELTITDMKFYLANVAMVNLNGTELAAKPLAGDSAQAGIWLINFTNPNFNAGFGLQSYKVGFEVPTGQYADARFAVEVPRQYNLSEITKNPYPVNGSNGMYWSWNSGFKFLVINGTSETVGPDGRNAVHLSIGQGSRAVDYNFRSMLLAAQRPTINVEAGKVTRIIYTYDINRLLTNVNGTPYSFVQAPGQPNPFQVHGGELSTVLQANSASAIDIMDFFVQE